MLTFIHCTLHIIKKSHNEFISGFHVIMIRDFIKFYSLIFMDFEIKKLMEENFCMKMPNFLWKKKLCDKMI